MSDIEENQPMEAIAKAVARAVAVEDPVATVLGAVQGVYFIIVLWADCLESDQICFSGLLVQNDDSLNLNFVKDIKIVVNG